MIEISYYKQKVYIICLDFESRERHLIEIWQKQAEKIVGQSAWDNKKLKKLIKYLDYRHGKVVFDAPNDIVL